MTRSGVPANAIARGLPADSLARQFQVLGILHLPMPIPHPQQLRHMIRQAIADRPALLSRLVKTRTLHAVIESRATAAEETFAGLIGDMPETQLQDLLNAQACGFTATVQWWNERDRQATQIALSQATEFSPEYETRAEMVAPSTAARPSLRSTALGGAPGEPVSFPET